ncbi:hypothetical protein [Mycoplasmopsis columbinasalis]|uniref:Lipoprotein n=1 Tax=Mycoplasmopsis columbinasalis TaxID=114880 RepID=A0A449BB16_9BACT|nr:hypothetical protein [Mycoplasmopsis columbinasalis]VEU78228.1 Uncharacterised protein [Mycoplasmopsis columbinasalis]
MKLWSKFFCTSVLTIAPVLVTVSCNNNSSSNWTTIKAELSDIRDNHKYNIGVDQTKLTQEVTEIKQLAQANQLKYKEYVLSYQLNKIPKAAETKYFTIDYLIARGLLELTISDQALAQKYAAKITNFADATITWKLFDQANPDKYYITFEIPTTQLSALNLINYGAAHTHFTFAESETPPSIIDSYQYNLDISTNYKPN